MVSLVRTQQFNSLLYTPSRSGAIWTSGWERWRGFFMEKKNDSGPSFSKGVQWYESSEHGRFLHGHNQSMSAEDAGLLHMENKLLTSALVSDFPEMESSASAVTVSLTPPFPHNRLMVPLSEFELHRCLSLKLHYWFASPFVVRIFQQAKHPAVTSLAGHTLFHIFHVSLSVLAPCKSVYETAGGWKRPRSEIKHYVTISVTPRTCSLTQMKMTELQEHPEGNKLSAAWPLSATLLRGSVSIDLCQ